MTVRLGSSVFPSASASIRPSVPFTDGPCFLPPGAWSRGLPCARRLASPSYFAHVIQGGSCLGFLTLFQARVRAALEARVGDRELFGRKRTRTDGSGRTWLYVSESWVCGSVCPAWSRQVLTCRTGRALCTWEARVLGQLLTAVVGVAACVSACA